MNCSGKTADKEELEKILKRIQEGVIIVEGKRDLEAVQRIGARKIYCAVGRINSVCKRVEEEKEAIILTDLDRKGHLLAERVREYLWSSGIKADVETRKKLGRILRIKYFEELDKKIEEFMDGELNG